MSPSFEEWLQEQYGAYQQQGGGYQTRNTAPSSASTAASDDEAYWEWRRQQDEGKKYKGAAIPPDEEHGGQPGPRFASGQNQNPPSGDPFEMLQRQARTAPGPGGDWRYWQQLSRSADLRRGGGGGGAGMRFDQAAIQENIRNQWRYLMLEEPSNLNGLVAEYIGDSQRMGMMLSMGAWLIQRARRDARYQLLYGRKPAELSEEEYIGSLRGVTEQLGLSSRGSRQQIEAAAGSGQTAAGFARRAGETREARSSNLGLFSRKVAQAFNSLGSLGRGA